MHRDVPLMYDEFNYMLKKQPLFFSLGGCLEQTERPNNLSRKLHKYYSWYNSFKYISQSFVCYSMRNISCIP